MTTGDTWAPSEESGAVRPALTPEVYDASALPDPLPADGAREVSLWLVRSVPEAGLHDIAVLDAAERKRTAAFVRPGDRDTYATSHNALRRLLGAYLDRDPAGIRFVREACPCCDEPHGRPALAEPGTPLHFSLSHTGDMALIGFARTPVGVDIEKPASPRTVAEVSGMLHPRERATLDALPEDGRPAAFARCWTRKEAYLKGTGSGLAGDLMTTTLVGAGPEPVTVPGWEMADVAVPEGYAAACAIRAAAVTH
ncbi:4'-phosphopantetheinyl transferase family protein [Streptomyces monomycini]|uniref:4'-phosphopantetheinyl transferase family protein n=1 Tax=Streptomyces monomycini TaxID=371720 RepID=UPI0004AA966B|nr:4'-phosphopantetheinyl transferase superfamily protein [Streptomyces monomycini]